MLPDSRMFHSKYFFKINPIRSNYVAAVMDEAQLNGKCRVCGDRDEANNHIINECSKVTQNE